MQKLLTHLFFFTMIFTHSVHSAEAFLNKREVILDPQAIHVPCMQCPQCKKLVVVKKR